MIFALDHDAFTPVRALAAAKPIAGWRYAGAYKRKMSSKLGRG